MSVDVDDLGSVGDVATAAESGLGDLAFVMRVDFSGSRFRVSFNGKQLFEVEDSTFADAGKVGLWTKADSVTLFDQVTFGEAK